MSIQAARAAVEMFWSVFAGGSDEELDEVLATRVDPAGPWHLSAPFDDVDAAVALRPLLGGMRHALGLAEAHLDVAIATGPEGDRSTVAVMGYLHGTWRDRWLGFSHPGAPVALRFGSVHHVDGAGRILESWVILDVLDLADRAGVANCPGHYDRLLVPGPARRDGDVARDGLASPEETTRSLALVDAMIQGLLAYDGRDLDSMGMERFWSADMAWYGPGAIGTGRTLRGFQDMHQRPFLAAFPDRTAGGESDVAFFADGAYVFAGGWPNVTGTHGGAPYLGVPAGGGPVGMRVMDWWRREGDLLTENWVLIDMIDLFAQLGRPLIVDGELRPSGVRHG